MLPIHFDWDLSHLMFSVPFPGICLGVCLIICRSVLPPISLFLKCSEGMIWGRQGPGNQFKITKLIFLSLLSFFSCPIDYSSYHIQTEMWGSMVYCAVINLTKRDSHISTYYLRYFASIMNTFGVRLIIQYSFHHAWTERCEGINTRALLVVLLLF